MTLEEVRRIMNGNWADTDQDKRRQVLRILSQSVIAGSTVQIFGPPWDQGRLDAVTVVRRIEE